MRRLFLACILLLFTVPVIWTGIISLGISHDNTTTPPSWNLNISMENYLQIRSEQTFFWGELATSILLSAVTTLLTVTIAFLAAYSLARSRFRGRHLAVNSLLVLSSLPFVSFAMPLSVTLTFLHLHDTFVGVTLAETALFSPLATYVLYGYLSQIPVEVEAAAWLDGANSRQVLLRVALPAIAPGVMATAVIVCVLSWNHFFLPLVLTTTQIKTIPVMMRDFFVLDREFEFPKVAAVVMISLLPLGIFVAIVHRSLEGFRLNFVSYPD